MGKKLTIEFVKLEFEKKGWICTSTEYIGAHSKLDYICPNGHMGSIAWDSWQHGHGCSECAGNKKPTIEFIQSEFEKENWVLVSTEYKNCYTKLDYICPEGHKGAIRWNDWQRGVRCGECAGNKKLTIEFVKSEFEKECWMLNSTKYINSSSKLDYICPNGHSGSITWNNWQRGDRCLICAGFKKITIESVKDDFEKGGYECTSKKYINSDVPLKYICPEGHHGSTTWTNWQQGKRCPICAGVKKHTIIFIKSEFEKEDWTCVSNEYINAHRKLDYICPNGHSGSITWNNWQRGRRCPECRMNGTSIWEVTIKAFVKKLNIPFLENDRTLILNPDTNRYVELDLWFPDLNKAIECNSKYWHSHRLHIDDLKQNWCKDNNVSLLSIDFDEWTEDIKKCQKKIKKFLN